MSRIRDPLEKSTTLVGPSLVKGPSLDVTKLWAAALKLAIRVRVSGLGRRRVSL